MSIEKQTRIMDKLGEWKHSPERMSIAMSMEDATEEQLDDIQGFIDYATEDGWMLSTICSNVMHDINGIASGDPNIVPRSKGYGKVLRG